VNSKLSETVWRCASPSWLELKDEGANLEQAYSLRPEPAAAVADRLRVVKPMATDSASKIEKGRTMCIWPETSPEGMKWYARWSDEDEAKKVLGWSRGEAIYNCVGNIDTAIVWDEEVIRQRQEKGMRREERQAPAPLPVKSIESQLEADLLKTAAAEPILTPAVTTRLSGNKTQRQQTPELQVQELQAKSTIPWMTRAWNWALSQWGSQKNKKRLRVCETVSLGERRFVAVVEVDGQQFLVGGASSSVATLARLDSSQEFSEMLKRRWSQEPVQA
jgi:Flagellar biosynthesis protein, FliO